MLLSRFPAMHVLARQTRWVLCATLCSISVLDARAQDAAPAPAQSEVPASVEIPAQIPATIDAPLQTLAPPASQEWPAGITTPEQPQPGANTSVVPRSSDPETSPGAEPPVVQLRLVALLTADGQKIDRDIVWRVFSGTGDQKVRSTLVNTLRTPTPMLRIPAGDYVINAAFGRANVTRQISVLPNPANTPVIERFVLNAGGMRVAARVAETAAPSSAVSYSIYSDRDQSGDRRLIISGVKPGLIIRLNAGIYHIVSTVGDANAIVESDVTVEAGKLSEASVAHAAAKATFKLVARPGGEALAGTIWTIKTEQGEIVKESTGALPTHVLAPGTYTAIAKAQGKVLQRPFTVTDGQSTQVEVIMQ